MSNANKSSAEVNDFGPKNRVCDFCGIPLPKGDFPTGSKVCKACTPKHHLLAQATVTPESQQQSYFDQQLSALKERSEPQIVNGIQKAIDKLGQSPQEIIAECVLDLMDPEAGNPDLTPEQKAALPRDHKTLPKYLKMLQEAQIHHDKVLSDSTPFQGVSPEDLKATILGETIATVKDDIGLRRELIIAFITRCPTFVDEVNQVASDLLEAVSSE